MLVLLCQFLIKRLTNYMQREIPFHVLLLPYTILSFVWESVSFRFCFERTLMCTRLRCVMLSDGWNTGNTIHSQCMWWVEWFGQSFNCDFRKKEMNNEYLLLMMGQRDGDSCVLINFKQIEGVLQDLSKQLYALPFLMDFFRSLESGSR